MRPVLRTATVALLATGLPLFAAVFFGLKQFQIWDQVSYYWLAGLTPDQLLQDFSPHALRYMMLYPVFVLSDALQVQYDVIFTWLVVILYMGTVTSVTSIVEVFAPHRKFGFVGAFFCALPILMLFFLINGRGAIAFFGYALVLLAASRVHVGKRLHMRDALYIVLGILLCGVSSGTFVSSLLVVVVLVWFEVIRMVKLSFFGYLSIVGLFSIVLIISIGTAMQGFIVTSVNKNLDFYGGGAEGFVEMLNHGAGSFIYPFFRMVRLEMALAICAVLAVTGSFLLMKARFGFLIHIIMAAVAIGVFGYTTLALAFIPVLVALFVFIKGGPRKIHRPEVVFG